MYNPVSTYRIQFHKDYTLADLEAALPYLQKLGIKTLYASPIFEAVRGSTHGYDGLNPHRINPELGTEEDLRRISAKLQEMGIGWLQDIVPNHMAFHPGNAWLMDVLEQGRGSEYASFFDILWDVEDRLMVPFLGDTLETVVGKGELTLVEEAGRWYFDYFGNRYPIGGAEGLRADLSKSEILQLAQSRHYRLCHWQETDKHINYRRFFTINGLICLNIHEDPVFEQYHRYIARLCSEGVFTGLRIDHIDGLYNPAKYLEDLRRLVGNEVYIVVEKILEPGEALPATWPIEGSTGYDFLSLANNLFTHQAGDKAFTRFYEKLAGDKTSIHQQLHDKKAHILFAHMTGELDNLTNLFIESGLGTPDWQVLRSAIGELLIQCPVYRYYGNALPLATTEAAAIDDILHRVAESRHELSEGVTALQAALLQQPADADPDYNRRALHFYQRCMQFSGPLMAKGVEDTLMYTYNRFIGHNDVGDSPESFGISREAFHKAMLERQERWPLAVNTTSTHDTKRGEDARALLNVLTAVPKEWGRAVGEWRAMNAGLKQSGAPDASDEYFIYQTLFATYPFEASLAHDYEARLSEYLEKALREGKRKSNWTEPDMDYEGGVKQFAAALLRQDQPFWQSFSAFRQSLLDYGIIQALAQVMVKFLSPGVPDTYQGTETWDLTMVDPDNRRPVDYSHRSSSLDELLSNASVTDLWEQRSNGQIKHWLTHELLQIRAANTELFAEGHYVPLRVTGRHQNHVFAFARRLQHQWMVVAVPLHLALLGNDPRTIDWRDTAIQLPPQAPEGWEGLLESSKGTHKGSIPVRDIFQSLPIALLKMERQPSERSAGVLMPITALPSAYSIGNLGAESRKFARMLSRAGQSYWQLLPLNPVSRSSAYSPYSSISSMAGNPLLISPDILVEEGLLDAEEARRFYQKPSETVLFEKAEKTIPELLDMAFARYNGKGSYNMKQRVDAFREREASWVADFALYVVIKRVHEDLPWYEWPAPYRQREEETLREFAAEHKEEIEKVVWQQAVFSMQWEELRRYCNSLGIKLIGDLPFYASYDSADVWTHPDIFSVDEQGKITGVSGVPPDYFSETGQLWGMPTFRWEALRAQNYTWWIDRLRKNLQLYDVLRIDHFRALAAYWEVPAGETTAVNGKWLEGPGTHFFDAVSEAFGGLPFIAEDLGDNMDDVYKLRDEVALPGMKVMQFAFGENLPTSVDAPHNYGTNFIAYTGTHDNNTTLGWFRKETGHDDRKRLTAYANGTVTEKNVNEVMANLVSGSVARTAILPMQDVLRLDESARLNTPGAAEGNWAWRMLPDAFSEKQVEWLHNKARFYNRL
jgi:malto-oligosyltrehalose synthase/4-alpha-glucanotransferase